MLAVENFVGEVVYSFCRKGWRNLAVVRRTKQLLPYLLLWKQIPAAFFGLFWLAKTQSSVMGENRLMHLILLIEFAMPSASVRVWLFEPSSWS